MREKIYSFLLKFRSSEIRTPPIFALKFGGAQNECRYLKLVFMKNEIREKYLSCCWIKVFYQVYISYNVHGFNVDEMSNIFV